MALLALLALTVTGCRSSRTVIADTSTSSESPKYTVMTFAGEVDGMSINGQVRMKKGEIIWGSVNKFLEVGRAMATPDSVWVRIPLMNRNFAGNYHDVAQTTGLRTSFIELQELLESDDAEARISVLAQRLGHNANIRIIRKESVEKLTFPFNK